MGLLYHSSHFLPLMISPKTTRPGLLSLYLKHENMESCRIARKIRERLATQDLMKTARVSEFKFKKSLQVSILAGVATALASSCNSRQEQKSRKSSLTSAGSKKTVRWSDESDAGSLRRKVSLIIEIAKHDIQLS